jgi:flagellar biosynthesis GTPase FlhF
MDMLKILKHTYKKSTEFVPFQMRSKHPDAYCRILSQQTKMIADQHVIVLYNITSDTMYYLSDRIASIKGVIDLKAVPQGEKEGKYRVLVNKDDFHQARKILQLGLPTWYAEIVAEDAKPHPDRFPGDPEVAQIMSDGYSSGEDSYYSSSVNTAMTYDSVSSDITNEFSKNTSVTNTDEKTEKTWSQRVKDGPKDPAKSTTIKDAPKSVNPNVIEGSLVSDLASSRAEVDDLKTQLSRMQDEQETERKYRAAKAEHQKREAELQAKAQKFELEKQAEEQRREFQEKMDEQRRELEKQSELQRRELEKSMQDQIAKAIQDHITRSTIPQLPEFQQMVANQGCQIQLLTRLMMQQMLNPDQASRSATGPTGKRNAAGLTATDKDDEETDTTETTVPSSPEVRKRADLKGTPKKPAPITTDHEVDVSMTSPRFPPYHASQALAPVADNYSKLVAVNLPIISRSVRRVKKRSARGIQSLRMYFTSVPSDE